MTARPGSSQVNLGTMKKSYQMGLVAFSGPSQVDLGTFSKLYLEAREGPSPAGLVAFSRPVQAHVEARRAPSPAGLIAYSKSFQEDLGSWPRPFQSGSRICVRPPMANLRPCLDHQGQAQGPSLNSFEQAPDDRSGPLLENSGTSAELVKGAQISLPLSTKHLQLQHKESLGPAQSWSSVEQGKGGSQTGMSQTGFPLIQTQEPLPNSEIQRELFSPLKLEKSPTLISLVKQFFGRKKGKETKASPSKKDQQQCQSLMEKIQTESPSPRSLHRIASEQLSSGQGNSNSEVQPSRHEEEQTSSHLHFPYRNLMNKGATVNVMSSTETGLIKEGQSLYVCDKFLMSNCQKGRNCPGYHTVLPFHWQFLHKEDNAWHSIPLGSQLHLEMLFTNPRRTMVIISYEHGKKVFFQMITKSFPKTAPFITARRITCQENSLFPPSFDFYWSADEEKWTPYNKQMQHLIQTSNKGVLKFISQPDNEEVTLDLNNLVQIKGNSVQLVTGRAEYTPLYQLVTKMRLWHREESNDLFLLGEEATDAYFGPYPAKNIVTTVKGKENYTLMEMLPSDIAYQNCCKHFYSSINHQEAVVLRAFRLYNPVLWEQYKRQKIKMSESINKTCSTPLEYHLFHQTILKMEEVAVNGLDPKLSALPGTLGLATYFSLHAQTTAMMNAEQAPDFGHVMVLAKVLVGEKAHGRPGLLSPPLNSDGQQCDCCVNDLRKPSLFAMFEKKYSYPYFIILYKLCRDTIHLAF